MIALLASSLLAVGAAPAHAQQPFGVVNGTEPLAPDAENEMLVVDDPERDGDSYFGPSIPVPAGDLDQEGDVVSLSIAETAEVFLFKLTHRGYDELRMGASQLTFGNFYCAIEFQINGYDRFSYGVDLFGNPDSEDGKSGLRVWGWTYVYEDQGNRRNWDGLGSTPVAFVDGDHFEFLFEKSSIRVGVDRLPLAVDDEITDIEGRCFWSAGAIVIGGTYDEFSSHTSTSAPGAYPVTIAAGSSQLGISFADLEDVSYIRPLTVVPGERAKVPVAIRNYDDRKLIVNLTASFSDQAGTEDAWKAVITPTLEVRGGSVTTATLVLTVPEDAAHRATGSLRITAQALGSSEQAEIERQVYVSAPLGPERDTLYFHNGWRGGGMQICILVCYGGASGNQIGPKLMQTQTEWFVTNTLETDPIFDREFQEAAIIRAQGWYEFGTTLDIPLAAPLRFDPDGTIDVQLTLAADVARDVDAELELVGDWGDVFVGRAEETLSLTPTPQAFTISIIPREDSLNLPPGTNLNLFIDLRDGPFGGDFNIGGSFEIYPAESQMTLPLLPVQKADLEITDGRALPTLQLREGSDQQEYVNPGDSKVYKLYLVNEGVERDVLEVLVETNATGWTYNVEPGKRFELEPGQSAPLALIVHAPEDAAEESIAAFNLTAKSRNDDNVRTSIILEAIATSGIDFESEAYEVSEEDHVDPYLETQEAPGLGLAFLIVPMLVGLLGGRSRRRA